MPAPITYDPQRLSSRTGTAVSLQSGATHFLKLVSKYHSSTGGFANSFFTGGLGLNPYAVARGTTDAGADIADGSKINIIKSEGQGVLAQLMFRWVLDNATQPTISSEEPKGILWGWYPDVQPASNAPLNFMRGAAGFRVGGDTTAATPSINPGIWVPLRQADGTIEVVFPTSVLYSGSDQGTSSTLANRTSTFTAPVEVLLRGAHRIMFLPTGGTSAPVFSSNPDDAQVICNFVN